MRVLSVASSLPFPPDDGTRVRTWNLLRRLAETDEVTLLTWVPPGTPPEAIESMTSTVESLVAMPLIPGREGALSRIRLRLLSTIKGVPPYVRKRIEEQLVPAQVPGEFDVAVAEDDCALFLMPSVVCPVAIHRHNIFADTISGLLASSSLGVARSLKWRFELPMWRRYDFHLSRRANLSLVTTPEAASSLRALAPASSVEIVPNGVEIPKRALEVARAPVAVFIGVMDYEPNVDAMVRFVTGFWPEISARVPEARLRIIGRRPLPKVASLASSSVEVTGEVADMVEACDGARLGVIPLEAGSGIKNKTIELMAMGLPVVASPAGAEGLFATDDDGLLLARPGREFVEKTVALLAASSRAEQLGAAARKFVSRFSWETSARTYREALGGLVDAAKGEARC